MDGSGMGISTYNLTIAMTAGSCSKHRSETLLIFQILFTGYEKMITLCWNYVSKEFYL